MLFHHVSLFFRILMFLFPNTSTNISYLLSKDLKVILLIQNQLLIRFCISLDCPDWVRSSKWIRRPLILILILVLAGLILDLRLAQEWRTVMMKEVAEGATVGKGDSQVVDLEIFIKNRRWRLMGNTMGSKNASRQSN